MKRIKLMELIREIIHEKLSESKAAEDAKRQGLVYMKFGRWGKNGKVTHRTLKDKVVPARQFFDPTMDKDKKSNDDDHDHSGPWATKKPKYPRRATHDQDGPFAREK